VTFFQGAPLLDEIHEDEWLFPLLPEQMSSPIQHSVNAANHTHFEGDK
jgi:hypothetical protein